MLRPIAIALALALVVALGCGSGGGSESRTSGPIEDRITRSKTALRFHAVRHEVDLATAPMRELIGLPMSGTVEIGADLVVPIERDRVKWSAAKGSIAMSCTSACRLGDDVAKLVPQTRNTRVQTLAGEGIEFGHVDLADFAVKVVFAGGRAEVSFFSLRSPDLVVDVSASARLADDLARSDVDVCVRYAPTDALLARSPKTHAVFSVLGGATNPDGMFSIRITGSPGSVRAMARPCETGLAP
jgi:hypothetical protein